MASDSAIGTNGIVDGEAIHVSVNSCTLSDTVVLPYSTEQRLQNLPDQVRHGRPFDTPVVVRATPSPGFEVIYGWDVICAHRDVGQDKAPVFLVDNTIENQLYWGIVRQAETLGLLWPAVASSLVRAKQRYRLSNEKCGTATLLGRTTVSRYINIATKLHPEFFAMAEKGRLTYSDCRRLIKLPMSRQVEIVGAAKDKALGNQAIMALAFPEEVALPSSTAPYSTTHATQAPTKSMDIKRFEVALAEAIGYPVEINPEDATERSGEISCQFFDRQGMIDVLTKLRRGFSAKANPKGRITVSFADLDEFEQITGGHFQEDSW